MVVKKIKQEWLQYENTAITISNKEDIIVRNQTVKSIDIINQTVFFKNGSFYRLKDGDIISTNIGS